MPCYLLVLTLAPIHPLASPSFRGLLKLVYATGTLAAGINMPARTTVISALSRRTDDGFALLPHNELLQVSCAALPARASEHLSMSNSVGHSSLLYEIA